MIRAIIAALLVAFAATAVDAAPIKAQQITRKTADYEIAIKYPQTGIASIDREIAAWAKAQADKFVAYVKEDRQDGSPWTLDITYKIPRNDAQMLEVVFAGQMMDDGNHAHFTFASFNYMMPDAHRVLIAEVVAPPAFVKMRAFTAAHIVTENPDFEATVTDGALAPTEDNFAAFVITSSALTVYVTPDQMGDMTSAGGHAIIPLTELKGMIRANWRAPAPSFDCAKAATAAEKAICSDVPLARLDREMTATYRLYLQSADSPAVRDRLKQEQQAWLAGRAKACPTGPAIIACLGRAYQARIAALKKP